MPLSASAFANRQTLGGGASSGGLFEIACGEAGAASAEFFATGSMTSQIGPWPPGSSCP